MKEVFQGPWFISERTSLEQQSGLSRGEIMKHTSGNLILNCPACNAMQFVTVTLEGDPPTLRGEVLCGAGRCQRCALRFSIRSGQTIVIKNEPPAKKKIEWSHISGTKKPPKIEE